MAKIFWLRGNDQRGALEILSSLGVAVVVFMTLVSR